MESNHAHSVRSGGADARAERASLRNGQHDRGRHRINVWDDKAFYGFWRPITAIREAHLDGNAATTADPDWLPLLENPPYPDHSSGASGQAGAFSKALEHFFGTNDIAWSDTNLGGQTRSFTRLSDARNEVVDARVWSGIHFLRADVHGALIGTNVADWANANFFQPVD